MTALYGRNGAGKTRILSALAAALQGHSAPDSWGILHVTVPDPEDFVGDPFREALEDAASRHMTQVRGKALAALAYRRDEAYVGNTDEDFDDALQDLMRFTEALVEEEFGPRSLWELTRAHANTQGLAAALSLGESESLVDDAFARHLADSGHVALLATGTEAAPRWKAYAALSSESPDDAALLDGERTYLRRVSAMVAAAQQISPDNRPRYIMDHLPRKSGLPLEQLSDLGAPFAQGAGYVPFGKSGLPLESDVARAPWPDWASNPVVELGEVSTSVVRTLHEDLTQDVNVMTRAGLSSLREKTGQVIALYDEGVPLYDPTMETYVNTVVSTANEVLREVLPDAPTLRFLLGDPHEWLEGELPHWVAVAGNQTVALSDLSAAQQRWAALACALSINMASDEPTPIWFLCDEPEAGLHRLVEKRLPAALSKVANLGQAVVVVATHSPAMLGTLAVSPVHVTRLPSDAATTRPLSLDLREGLDRELASLELGLTAPDLLQLVRVFLLVEGQHDEVVLRTMLGEDLDPNVVIYPMGGAKHIASLATAALLWDFTEAEVMLVLDGRSADRIRPIWDEALLLADRGDERGALRSLQELTTIAGGEAKWLHDLLSRAIREGRTCRLHLQTLSEPDIICYLPADAFIKGQSWERLKSEWQMAAKGHARDLKRFLRERYQVRVNTKMLGRIAETASDHPELDVIAFRVAELAAFGSSRNFDSSPGDGQRS